MTSRAHKSALWNRRESAEDRVLSEADLGDPVPEFQPSGRTMRRRGPRNKTVAQRLQAFLGAVNRTDLSWKETLAVDVVRSRTAIAKTIRLAAVGCKCEACGTAMPAEGLVHLHHVIFVARGGTNEDKNTVLLCPNCHATAHWLDSQLPEDERPNTRDELIQLLNGEDP